MSSIFHFVFYQIWQIYRVCVCVCVVLLCVFISIPILPPIFNFALFKCGNMFFSPSIDLAFVAKDGVWSQTYKHSLAHVSLYKHIIIYTLHTVCVRMWVNCDPFCQIMYAWKLILKAHTRTAPVTVLESLVLLLRMFNALVLLLLSSSLLL